jgi:hypothetical protein
MSNINSKIETSERVVNKERKFGAALEYFPAYVIDDTGKEVPVLFTKNQLSVAAKRAEKNMEDMPKGGSWFDWLFTEL